MSARTWSTAKDVAAHVEKLWAAGAVLRELNLPATEWVTFPAAVRLKGPDKAELSGDYLKVDGWRRALVAEAARAGWCLETGSRTDRVYGKQIIPTKVYLDTPQIALGLLSRAAREQAHLFQRLLTETQTLPLSAVGRQIALRQPHLALASAKDWPLLLTVAQWLVENPRSGVKMRQVPVPGMHTKLIEQNSVALTALLDAADPSLGSADARSFAARYGLHVPARPVRLRAAGHLLGVAHLDEVEVYWPSDAAATHPQLPDQITQVVIVENLVTFQALPCPPGRLVIWGDGKEAPAILRAIPWLNDIDCVYWGDIDTHGLHILDLCRAVIPHLRSILMDEQTLLAHKPWWATEDKPYVGQLTHLTGTEAALHQALRDGTYGPKLRFEQEFLRLDAAIDALE